MRIVLDANVWVSALISNKGAPARILELWRLGDVEVVISPAILAELDRVLRYPKLLGRYNLPQNDIGLFLRQLERQCIGVVPAEEVGAIVCDPADNRYLECAVAGEAAVIVSGDRHLLELKEYEGIQILTPAELLLLLKS
jgi:uncharacterized protein